MMVKKAEDFTLSDPLLIPFPIIRGGQPEYMMTRLMTRLTLEIWHMQGIWRLRMEDLIADDNGNQTTEGTASTN